MGWRGDSQPPLASRIWQNQDTEHQRLSPLQEWVHVVQPSRGEDRVLDPLAIALLGRETLEWKPQKRGSRIFQAALFIAAKFWKPPPCLSTEKGMSK